MKNKFSFKELHNAIVNNVITCEDASSLMMDSYYKNQINTYLESFANEELSLSTHELDVLKDILSVAYYIYTYSGLDTGINDTEYDKLVDMYEYNTGEQIFSLQLKNGEKEEHHKYPVLRGTLEKIYYLKEVDENEKVNTHRKSLDKWKIQCQNIIKEKTGEVMNMDNVEVYCFPKWDGVSCIFEFDNQGKLDRALTRGFTQLNTAENITSMFKMS